jgi:outer membrane protein
MLNRPLICAALFPILCAVFALQAHAASIADPFSTVDLLTPPALAAADDGSFVPCPARHDDTRIAALSLADVVDAALCGNPQTREAWANARVQAANVGRTRSSWLPSLDGSLLASRNNSRGGALASRETRTQRDYDLSLSWLIYDFGGREASQRNAQELLAAANAAGDATVQSLFLAAVQAFYQLQANLAAHDAAAEAGTAAQESFKAAEARYTVGVATPADKLQAQTALSQAKLSLIQAEGNVRNAQGVLANVMGLNASTPLRLVAPGDAPPAAEFAAGIDQLIEEGCTAPPRSACGRSTGPRSASRGRCCPRQRPP